jgi:BNR repeat-like domain
MQLPARVLPALRANPHALPGARTPGSLRTRKVAVLLGAVASALSLLFIAIPAQAASGPLLLSVDPYTNTFSAHQTEVEPASFSFGSTIVSAFQVGRVFIGASANIGWATSRDGGRSWRHGFLPRTTINATPPGTYARSSDASVAFDARHHQWLISWLGAPSITSNAIVDVLVSRSANGIAWTPPKVIAQRNEFLDKNWTTCDNTPSSPFFGHCYTEFEDPTEANLIFMTTSTDGGRTWGQLSNTADQAHGVGGQPVVQPNGTVVVPIEVIVSGQTTISSFTSDDGGLTWSATNLIADAQLHRSAANIRNGGVLPSAGEDAAGRVYVTWADCRFEPGCEANDIVLSSSADGSAWTAPARIPLDPAGSMVDHFTPGLGVDRATVGRHAHLALGYYYYPQADCTIDTCQLDVGFASSVNGGRTWSSGAHVAGPMTVTWLAPTSSGFMAGDYMASPIVTGTLSAFPVFAAASPPVGTVLHENMYTARELVLGGGLPAGAGQASGRSPARQPAIAPLAGAF